MKQRRGDGETRGGEGRGGVEKGGEKKREGTREEERTKATQHEGHQSSRDVDEEPWPTAKRTDISRRRRRCLRRLWTPESWRGQPFSVCRVLQFPRSRGYPLSRACSPAAASHTECCVLRLAIASLLCAPVTHPSCCNNRCCCNPVRVYQYLFEPPHLLRTRKRSLLLRPLLNALFAPVFRSKRNLRVLPNLISLNSKFTDISRLSIQKLQKKGKKKKIRFVALILGRLQQTIYKQFFVFFFFFHGSTLTIFFFISLFLLSFLFFFHRFRYVHRCTVS